MNDALFSLRSICSMVAATEAYCGGDISGAFCKAAGSASGSTIRSFLTPSRGASVRLGTSSSLSSRTVLVSGMQGTSPSTAAISDVDTSELIELSVTSEAEQPFLKSHLLHKGQCCRVGRPAPCNDPAKTPGNFLSAFALLRERLSDTRGNDDRATCADVLAFDLRRIRTLARPRPTLRARRIRPEGERSRRAPRGTIVGTR